MLTNYRYLPEIKPCGRGVGHDVAPNGLLRVRVEHGGTIHLCHYLQCAYDLHHICCAQTDTGKFVAWRTVTLKNKFR
jgi:hypothetical protein